MGFRTQIVEKQRKNPFFPFSLSKSLSISLHSRLLSSAKSHRPPRLSASRTPRVIIDCTGLSYCSFHILFVFLLDFVYTDRSMQGRLGWRMVFGSLPSSRELKKLSLLERGLTMTMTRRGAMVVDCIFEKLLIWDLFYW